MFPAQQLPRDKVTVGPAKYPLQGVCVHAQCQCVPSVYEDNKLAGC